MIPTIGYLSVGAFLLLFSVVLYTNLLISAEEARKNPDRVPCDGCAAITEAAQGAMDLSWKIGAIFVGIGLVFYFLQRKEHYLETRM